MAKEQAGLGEEVDRRIIERKLIRCRMTNKDLKKYLAKLPDVSVNAEQVVIELDPRTPGSAKSRADAD